MAKVQNGIETLPKISNQLRRLHERHRQTTDKQIELPERNVVTIG